MVQRCIKKFVNPSVGDIHQATGLARSSISSTEAWKSHMARRHEKESKKSVNTRNLRKRSMDSFGADQDPSLHVEMREVLEPYYLEVAGDGDVEDYNMSDDEGKLQKLVEFAERTKKDVEKYCRENPEAEGFRDYPDLANTEDLEVLFIVAQQIRDMRSEKVDRKRSQDEL
jgi:hypothetical protein